MPNKIYYAEFGTLQLDRLLLWLLEGTKCERAGGCVVLQRLRILDIRYSKDLLLAYSGVSSVICLRSKAVILIWFSNARTYIVYQNVTKRNILAEGQTLRCELRSDENLAILIRAVDGLTSDKDSFKLFLKVTQNTSNEALIIFQFNKVCDDIRPHNLRDFEGLIGTADFMADEFMECLDGKRIDVNVQRILDIWEGAWMDKSNAQDIQDRNTTVGSPFDKESII